MNIFAVACHFRITALVDRQIFVTGSSNVPASGAWISATTQPTVALKHRDSCEPCDHAWEFPNANMHKYPYVASFEKKTYDQFAALAALIRGLGGLSPPPNFWKKNLFFFSEFFFMCIEKMLI